LIVAFALACGLAWSCGGERGAGRTPTAPAGGASSTAASAPSAARGSSGGGAVMGAVTFPPRNEPFDFRANVLEAKYRDQLRRGPTSSFVDIEGTIVWTQEYLLYRVSGCAHQDSIQRVMRQIDGAPFQGTCTNSTFAFPPRNEPFDFRNQLEAKYRDGLRRGSSQTFVDVEGDIVWTQEYLRYRVSGCGHTAASQKVTDQIDGRGIQADCAGSAPAPPAPTPPTPPTPTPPTPPTPGVCTYSVGPTTHSVPSTGNDQESTVATQAGCTWTAASNASFVTILSGSSGTGSGTVRFRVAPNSGADRSGIVRVQWPNPAGGQDVTVNQASGITPLTANFTYSPNPCPLTGPTSGPQTNTIIRCTFDASSSTSPNGISNYRWDFTNVPGQPGGPVTDRTAPTITDVSLGCLVPGGSYDRMVTLTITGSTGGTSSISKTVTFRKDSGC
jgi:all-beta uncharacterized protein